MAVLFQGVTGSHAHGLNHAGSDVDRVVVFNNPTWDYLGLYPPSETSSAEKTTLGDTTYHEVGKFCRLGIKANPSILEVLWLDQYEEKSPEGEELISLRRDMLSVRAVKSAYLGYANSQFNGAARSKSAASSSKYGRHFYRLLCQGVELYRDGNMQVKVEDPEKVLAFGERMALGHLQEAKDLLTWAEEEFSKPSALPEEPNIRKVNDWLVDLRIRQLEIETTI